MTSIEPVQGMFLLSALVISDVLMCLTDMPQAYKYLFERLSLPPNWDGIDSPYVVRSFRTKLEETRDGKYVFPFLLQFDG